MEVILLLAALFVLYFIFSKTSKPVRKPATTETAMASAASNFYFGAAHAFHWTDGGNYEVEVVGESFYQSHLRNLAGNHGDDFAEAEYKATLIPDDLNKHDNKAVAVYINDGQVGHLSKEDARSFRRRLARKKLAGQATSTDAVIRGGGVRNGRRFSYGVFLDMKPFDN